MMGNTIPETPEKEKKKKSPSLKNPGHLEGVAPNKGRDPTTKKKRCYRKEKRDRTTKRKEKKENMKKSQKNTKRGPRWGKDYRSRERTGGVRNPPGTKRHLGL